MMQLTSTDIDVIEMRNKEVQLIKWKELINKCLSLQYKERTLMLMDHYSKDHSSFID
jgi:hypothetical protein